MILTQNEAFNVMLHDHVAKRLCELDFADANDCGFGNMIGEICQQITSEIPVPNLCERIEELCLKMKSRCSGAQCAVHG